MAASQKRKNNPQAHDKEQSKLFIQKARKIEADEERSASDELLGRLAKMPPRKQRMVKCGRG